MKVEIDKSFAMPGSAEVAWALLQDLEKVAACMPGAKITERLGENSYKGTVAVKFGPANMSFRGEVQVQQMDATTKTLRLVGKGTDSTGSSGAAMDLTARVDAVDAAGCTLVGHSEVSMSGKAATFGGRMAGAVADQVLKQFAGNFAAQVQALQAHSQAQSQATQAPPGPDVAAEEGAVPVTLNPAPVGAPAPAAPQVESQLNGLSLAWAVFKDWLRSLFSARRA